jgi:UDP-2-acetamido-2-deoxy-ribo-hexuluronate aminotransferase
MTVPAAATQPIPITDLGREYAEIRSELQPILDRILASGAYILGSEVGQFEVELARYLGTSHAIAVNSGTDAVHLALKALNLKPGDEVILPAMTFFATLEPILHLGLTPVLADIDPISYGLDPEAVIRKLTSRTKAVIVVHLYGLAADCATLNSIADKARVTLIEDMAQAIGASFDGKRVGAWGRLSCLSFYPTKNLGACGDGGAVMTSSSDLADRIRQLRNHGAKVKYHHEEAAYNSRLDEIQAAILRLKLVRLDQWNDKRRRLASLYSEALAGLPLTLPREPAGRRHVYHLYSIQTDRRDDLRAHLEAAGIATGLHYPLPLHLLPALKGSGFKEGDFPVSERLARQTLSLPLYPFMEEADVARVAEAVRRCFRPLSSVAR